MTRFMRPEEENGEDGVVEGDRLFPTFSAKDKGGTSFVAAEGIEYSREPDDLRVSLSDEVMRDNDATARPERASVLGQRRRDRSSPPKNEEEEAAKNIIRRAREQANAIMRQATEDAKRVSINFPYHITLTGYLNKFVRFGSAQRRWFELRGPILVYYVFREHSEPKGCILLEGCTLQVEPEDWEERFSGVGEEESGQRMDGVQSERHLNAQVREGERREERRGHQVLGQYADDHVSLHEERRIQPGMDSAVVVEEPSLCLATKEKIHNDDNDNDNSSSSSSNNNNNNNFNNNNNKNNNNNNNNNNDNDGNDDDDDDDDIGSVAAQQQPSSSKATPQLPTTPAALPSTNNMPHSYESIGAAPASPTHNHPSPRSGSDSISSTVMSSRGSARTFFQELFSTRRGGFFHFLGNGDLATRYAITITRPSGVFYRLCASNAHLRDKWFHAVRATGACHVLPTPPLQRMIQQKQRLQRDRQARQAKLRRRREIQRRTQKRLRPHHHHHLQQQQQHEEEEEEERKDLQEQPPSPRHDDRIND